MRLSYFLPFRHRTLIWQFARREVLTRYRGSMMGMGWALLTPLLMLCVYTLVFRGIFKARWADNNAGDFDFALQVYLGLIVFNVFAEVANRSPRLVLEEPNLVKKVIFPLEILPWVIILAGFFHLFLNTLALLVASIVIKGGVPLSAVTLPLVLAPLVPLLLGLAWLLAGLGVFIRDMQQVTNLLVSLLMFLSPVFYPIANLPSEWRKWLQLNPLAPLIEQSRQVALDGSWPDWLVMLKLLVATSVFAWVCARWFAAARKGFADVM